MRIVAQEDVIIEYFEKVINAVESDSMLDKSIDDGIPQEIAVTQEVVVVSLGLDEIYFGFDPD